jgi:transposase-like protein
MMFTGNEKDQQDGESRKFTPEYKAEAVALVVESGRSVKDVAESLLGVIG